MASPRRTTLFDTTLGDLPANFAVFNNFAATTAPAVTDDSGDGYGVGSIWVNTSANTVYMCTNAAVGAAHWTQLG